MPAARHIRITALTAGALGVAGIAGVACGDDEPQRDAAAFCAAIRADTAAVVSPALSTPADVDAALATYRRLSELAPESVTEEWDVLVLNLETAATVVPSDPDSVQRAVAQAYATEKSAVAVSQWLLANCGIDLGPVTTIVPQDRPTPATQPPSTDPLATTPPLGTEPAG